MIHYKIDDGFCTILCPIIENTPIHIGSVNCYKCSDNIGHGKDEKGKWITCKKMIVINRKEKLKKLK
jgi:hypothetical protein